MFETFIKLSCYLFGFGRCVCVWHNNRALTLMLPNKHVIYYTAYSNYPIDQYCAGQLQV